MYLRHLSTEYRSILSADISAEYRSICRPRLGRHIGRHQPTRTSADTRPILYRNSAATWPILYRHSANTTLICSAIATEFYLLCSTKRDFQGPTSICGLQLWIHSRLFSSYVFFLRRHFCIQPSLLSEVAAFGACCLRRFVIISSFFPSIAP